MGKGLLNEGKNVLIETVHVCEVGPCVLKWTTLNLLPRTSAVMNAGVELKGKPKNKMSVVKTNNFLSHQHLNLVVPPAIHILTKHVNMIVPFVLVNLVTESIFLDKHDILFF